MEIWQLNEDTIRKGRPISRITEATIFREAEMIFNCEIGHALGYSAADVPGVIRRMVKTAAAAQDRGSVPVRGRFFRGGGHRQVQLYAARKFLGAIRVPLPERVHSSGVRPLGFPCGSPERG